VIVEIGGLYCFSSIGLIERRKIAGIRTALLMKIRPEFIMVLCVRKYKRLIEDGQTAG